MCRANHAPESGSDSQCSGEIPEPVYVVVQYRPLSPDPNEDMVLDVSINGNADAIVTNNTKHFRDPAERFHLEVLTPAELLSKVRKRR